MPRVVTPHQVSAGGADTPTVPALLADRAARDPEATAIVDARGDLTYGAWHRAATVLARALGDAGLRRGDRVALLHGTDWTGYAVAFGAVLAAGGVAVPLPSGLPPRQAEETLRRTGVRGVLHSGDEQPPAGPWWSSTAEDLLARATGRSAAAHVRPGDLAQIVCTSGSTGTPKDVGATHANLCHGATAPRRGPRRYAHSRAMLHAFPIGTNAAQMMLIEALTAHPALVCAGRFEAEEFCALIERHQVGTVFLVPAMAAELLRSEARRRHDLGAVQLVSSSAAALPPALARGIAAAFPNAFLVNYYTSTEAVPAQVSMLVDADRPDALGRPADPRDLRIADEDGRPLPAGTVGEVWLRSDAPPRRYENDPEASAGVFRDGWVRMGDLGRIDEAGYLYLVDRDSDVIKSGALKVSTLRIEAALLEHPLVAEAAVVGVPSPVMGTVPAAVVRADPGLDLDQLRDHLARRLSRAERPVWIVPVAAIPRTATGKPVKPQVRTMVQEAVAAPAPAAAPAVLAVPDTRAADPFGRSFMTALPSTATDPAHRTEASPDAAQ